MSDKVQPFERTEAPGNSQLSLASLGGADIGSVRHASPETVGTDPGVLAMLHSGESGFQIVDSGNPSLAVNPKGDVPTPPAPTPTPETLPPSQDHHDSPSDNGKPTVPPNGDQPTPPAAPSTPNWWGR